VVEALAQGGTVALAVTMMVAGGGKILTLNEFQNLLETLAPQPLPRRTTRLVAALIVALELGGGILLIIRPVLGVAIISPLLIAFTFVAISIARSGERLRCACFGPLSDSLLGYRTAARNCLLLAVGLAVILQNDGQRVSLASVLTGSLAAVFFFVLARVLPEATRSRDALLDSMGLERPGI
jgi:uncharacterized membrane protein YphA (DoxX/SURF4 family)